jgi:hypothetical protein
VLLLVPVGHQEVLDVLRPEPGECLVGPTSPAGWTAVWRASEPAALLAKAGPYVGLERRGRTGFAIWVVARAGAHECALGSGRTHGGDVARTAELLGGLFGAADRTEALVEILSSAAHPDDLLNRLSEALDGFPEVTATEPDRSVVAIPGEAGGARLAATLAGPAHLTTCAGWALLTPAEDPSRCGALAGAASGLGRGVALSLWRGAGGQCGVTLFEDGRPVDSVAWGSGWHELGRPRAAVADDLGRRLAGHVPAGQDPAELAELLGATSWEGDPLAVLSRLVGLPATTVEVLDGEPGVETELVARTSPARAAVTAPRHGGPAQWARLLWLRGRGAGRPSHPGHAPRVR